MASLRVRSRCTSVVGPALIAVAATAQTAAAQVVVFPLDPRGVDPVVAQRATDAVLAALSKVEGLPVIDPQTVERQLGLDLTVRARQCQYDVFCLVEIGEILETSTVLLGHVQRRLGDETLPFELKMVVLDVDRAAIAEVLIWRMADAVALTAAAGTAGRRLFSPRDANVTVRIEPPDATVRLYEEPQTMPRAGPWSTWSGTYRLRVTAEGYLPVDRAWAVPPGESALRLSLEPDPLFVRPVIRSERPAPSASPFDDDVDARTLRIPPQRQTPSRFSRPWPWITTGTGVAAAVAGTVLMALAQADYNDVAEEARFSAGTSPVFAARDARDDADLQNQIGAGFLIGGRPSPWAGSSGCF